MVSASHAKGAAEIAARGISVTKEIAYATVLGLAGGAVFKARAHALAALVGRVRARCRPCPPRTHWCPGGCRAAAAACAGGAEQSCAARRVAQP